VRTILVVALLAAGFAAGPHPPAIRRPVVSKPPLPSPPSSAFSTTVRPILATRCAPCHNPGGRMYARLPFDDPMVVSSHSAGVLRRLKGEDRAAMQRWIAGLAPADAAR
jgi:hypothetical protein